MITRDWREVKRRYWDIVDEILRNSDIILNILDSRFYNETRNKFIEEKVRAYRRKWIFVLNKSDLVPLTKLQEAFDELSKIAITVPLSCRDRRGKIRLIKAITQTVKKRPMRIGVVGYPNTGKSSVINYLTGRKAARTSPVAGFTRGMQWIKLSKNIKLIDTPGVIPLEEKDEAELAVKDTLTKVQDVENVALKIISVVLHKNKNLLEQRYNIKPKLNPEEVLAQIAVEKKKLKKKGELDIESAARMVINDWQKGRLKLALHNK